MRTTRMPFPPPPATAFTSSGYRPPQPSGTLHASSHGAPGHDRHAGAIATVARARLAAHRAHRRGARADERRARPSRRRRRSRGSPPGIRSPDAPRRRPTSRRVDQLIDPKVAFRCLVRPDRMRFVRQPHMKRVAVALRIHRDRGEPHVAARPDDPHGDLAAVGDEYFFQVGRTSGSAPVIVASTRVTVAGSSVAGTRCGLQRDIAVLLRRVFLALGRQRAPAPESASGASSAAE